MSAVGNQPSSSLTGFIPFDEGWEQRVRVKIGLTALATVIGTFRGTRLTGRRLIEDLPHNLTGYVGAMTGFCCIQESLRTARGRHDALNSMAAGAVAGGAAAGIYQGRQFRLLGALTWGTICGVTHLVNDLTGLQGHVEDFLVDEGLLDPRVAERRKQRAALLAAKNSTGVALPQLPRGEDVGSLVSDKDMMRATAAIRARELEALSRGPAAAGSSSPPAADDDEEDDDEEGFQRWLSSSAAVTADVVYEPAAGQKGGKAGAGKAAKATPSGSGQEAGASEAGSKPKRTWGQYLRSWIWIPTWRRKAPAQQQPQQQSADGAATPQPEAKA